VDVQVVGAGTTNVTPPVLVPFDRLRVSGAEVTAGTLTLNFDAALKATADTRYTPDVSQFTVSGGPAVTAVSVTGTVVTLTLGDADDATDDTTAADDLTVSYSLVAVNEHGHARPSNSRLLTALNSAVGRDETVDPFSNVRVRNDNPPVLLEDGGATVNGDTVTLTFNTNLRGNPGEGAFSLSGSTVTGARVSGNTVTLTLETALDASGSGDVSYTAPDVDINTGVSPLGSAKSQHADANVVDISGEAVVNLTPPTLSIGAVNAGQTVSLTSDADLASLQIQGNDLASSNLAGHTDQFEVEVGGTARAVTTVEVEGTTVTLTLAGDPLASTNVVSVSYAKSADADYRLKTAAGSEVDNTSEPLGATVS
jgi:uncharacterized repeat protein (TIGR02059 family)